MEEGRCSRRCGSGGSGIADFLSTVLFTMSREEGTELLKKYGAEEYWIDTESKVSMTDGFRIYIKNN